MSIQPRTPSQDRTQKESQEEWLAVQTKVETPPKISMETKLPERKSPPVPPGRKVLIRPPAESTFLSRLNFDSLQKLRRIVKQTHMTGWPAHLYTDYEADKIIEAIGPGCVVKMMAQGLGSGLIERNIQV